MIFDPCKCGAEFRVGYTGLHAAGRDAPIPARRAGSA